MMRLDLGVGGRKQTRITTIPISNYTLRSRTECRLAPAVRAADVQSAATKTLAHPEGHAGAPHPPLGGETARRAHHKSLTSRGSPSLSPLLVSSSHRSSLGTRSVSSSSSPPLPRRRRLRHVRRRRPAVDIRLPLIGRRRPSESTPPAALGHARARARGEKSLVPPPRGPRRWPRALTLLDTSSQVPRAPYSAPRPAPPCRARPPK